MKIEQGPLRLLKLTDEAGIRAYTDRQALRATLAALEGGHGDALRHFAAHGELPPEAPVWPGLETERAPHYERPAWDIRRPDGERRLIACVRPRGADGSWECIPASTHRAIAGPTPQAAVDAAREELRRWWAL